MSTGELLVAHLKGVGSQAAGNRLQWQDASGVRVDVDLIAVEQLGCAFRDFRLALPAWQGASAATMSKWAAELTRHVNYLLEQVGPIEHDAEMARVLIRSTPPDRTPERIDYYEFQLSAPGELAWNRYRAIPGQLGRTQLDVQVTYEVLRKLVNDIVATGNAAAS